MGSFVVSSLVGFVVGLFVGKGEAAPGPVKIEAISTST